MPDYSAYGANPYLDSMVNSAQQNVIQNFNNANVSSGSFGNAGVQNDFARNLGQVATNMYGNAYNSGLQYNLGLGNLGLGYTNANNNFYTQQRGQDLQQAELGSNLYNAGNAGYLNQGQGIYNLGLTAQNAPWQAVSNFNSAASPYTGFGSTTQNAAGSFAGGALGGGLLGAQMYNLYNKGGSSVTQQNLDTANATSDPIGSLNTQLGWTR